MNLKSLAVLSFALAGSFAASAAEVQWQVTFGSPRVGVVVGSPVHVPRAHSPRRYVPVVTARPVVVVPSYGVRRAGWRDADRDGIPNRYDRAYNPRWDRDGDGLPNRHDRHPNRHGR